MGDNIYIGNDLSAARSWAASSFGAKDAKEAAIRKAKLANKRAEERLKKFNEGGFANTMNYYLGEIGVVLPVMMTMISNIPRKRYMEIMILLMTKKKKMMLKTKRWKKILAKLNQKRKKKL